MVRVTRMVGFRAVVILVLTIPVISFIPGTKRQVPLDPNLKSRLLAAIKPVKEEEMSPVILITALCGAQLWAQWNLKEKPHWWCDCESKGWEQVWLNLEWFVILKRDCWPELVKLRYNSSTHEYQPWVPGVTVSVGNGTKHIRYIDQDFLTHIDTFEFDMIIDALTAAGYTPDKNIIAFPYDWRIGPDAYFLPGGIFDTFQSTIEHTFSNNSNKPVVLVGESMGNAVANLFLQHRVNQTWKDKYIKALVSMSGIYAGAGLPLYSMVTPTTYDLPQIVGKELITDALRTFGGIAWLFPDADYWGDYVIMKTPAGNYTARDIPTILTKANLSGPLELYQAVRNLTVRAAPNVTVYCYYGTDVNTSNYFVYGNDKFEGDPEIVPSSGDGSVPLQSLEACKLWGNQQTKPVYVKPLKNVTHQGILHNSWMIHQIVAIATGNNNTEEFSVSGRE